MESELPPNFPKSFGWIGVGAMGFPMAINLQKKLPRETKLLVYDVDNCAMDRFVQATSHQRVQDTQFGAAVSKASSPRDVVENSDCVITIVPEGSHVRAVYRTPETGILFAPDIAGKIFIDCSTIDIATSQLVAESVKEAYEEQRRRMNMPVDNPPLFVDAPVSGGTAGASAGTLTIMLGCSPSSPYLPLLTSIFLPMAPRNKIYPMGGPSLGLAAKLSNNYLSSMINLATSEAMNLGMRLGIDPKVLQKCFSTSSGSSWVNNTINPVPGVCPDAVTSKGYEGGFKVQLMKKDLGLAVEAARQVGAKLVLADAGLSAYTAASEDPRCRDRDARVVYRWLGGIEPEVGDGNKPTDG
ncbi:hypothetical protein D9613_000215 [Agrocybe pediades]|uniref:3-hydroxyisobutyrate dehydrogenase n=1 Tax=Agrocybe pediades TaxID=84607 RepID=A0A8H4R275_9AGAR|nr:hypothetical protein D9613_000215 [Agrocybe pediades]